MLKTILYRSGSSCIIFSINCRGISSSSKTSSSSCSICPSSIISKTRCFRYFWSTVLTVILFIQPSKEPLDLYWPIFLKIVRKASCKLSSASVKLGEYLRHKAKRILLYRLYNSPCACLSCFLHCMMSSSNSNVVP